jgi:hypothetical protein
MTTIRTRPIPFNDFTPCDVPGCETYADHDVIVGGNVPARALCREHLALVRAAAKRGPGSDGVFRGPDGRPIWSERGWI